MSNNNATFLLTAVEGVHEPLTNIEIPQFALHFRSSKFKVPCVIIQSERVNETSILGYKNLINGEKGAALLEEFKLFGDKPPLKQDW